MTNSASAGGDRHVAAHPLPLISQTAHTRQIYQKETRLAQSINVHNYSAYLKSKDLCICRENIQQNAQRTWWEN